MKVNLGCGKDIRPGWVNLDCRAAAGVDVVCRVKRWLPFRAEVFEHVVACHFFEHFADKVGIVEEVYRVLKPGGLLEVRVPKFPCGNAVEDPTHRSFWNEWSMDFVIPGNGLNYVSRARFIELSKGVTDDEVFWCMRRV